MNMMASTRKAMYVRRNNMACSRKHFLHSKYNNAFVVYCSAKPRCVIDKKYCVRHNNVFMLLIRRKYTQACELHDACLKWKKFRLLVTVYRRAIWLKRSNSRQDVQFFSVFVGFVLKPNLRARTEFDNYDAEGIKLLHCVSAFLLQLPG